MNHYKVLRTTQNHSSVPTNNLAHSDGNFQCPVLLQWSMMTNVTDESGMTIHDILCVHMAVALQYCHATTVQLAPLNAASWSFPKQWDPIGTLCIKSLFVPRRNSRLLAPLVAEFWFSPCLCLDWRCRLENVILEDFIVDYSYPFKVSKIR